MNIHNVENTLMKLGISVFSVTEFSRLFKISPALARSFLARNSNKNGSHILKLKRGIYAFSINPTTELEIANKLCQPSYISFETALSYYGIIPETVYAITSATTKRSKEVHIRNSIYKYYRIRKELYFGYQLKKIKDKDILLAEAEKALLDYIYILSLRKGVTNERLNLDKINQERFNSYIECFIKVIKKKDAFLSLINKIYQS